jgi:hypothetical protein
VGKLAGALRDEASSRRPSRLLMSIASEPTRSAARLAAPHQALTNSGSGGLRAPPRRSHGRRRVTTGGPDDLGRRVAGDRFEQPPDRRPVRGGGWPRRAPPGTPRAAEAGTRGNAARVHRPCAHRRPRCAADGRRPGLHTASTGREAPRTTVGPRGGLFERPPRCARQTEGLRCEPATPFSKSSRSTADAFASTGSKSCRTTPNGELPPSSVPRPRSTRMPRASAIARDPLSTAFLPIPAGPSTTTRLSPRSRARSSAAATLASSPSRSRSAEPVGRAELLMPVPGFG